MDVISCLPTHLCSLKSIKAIAIAFKGVLEIVSNSYFISRVIKLLPEQQCTLENIKAIATVFYKFLNPIAEHIEGAIKILPEEQRTFENIKAIIIIFKEINDSAICCEVVNAAKALPKEQRTFEIIRAICTVFKEINNSDIFYAAVKAARALPEEQRTFESIMAIGTFFKGINNPAICYAAVNAARALPEEQRSLKGIRVIASGFLGILDREVCSVILSAIKVLPEEQRTHEILAGIFTAFNDMWDRRKREYIFKAIKAIPKEQHTLESINAIITVFDGYMDDRVCDYILEIIYQFPEEQKSANLINVIPFIKGGLDGLEKAALLKAVGLLPADNRKSILQKKAQGIDEISNGYGRVIYLLTDEPIHFPFIQNFKTVLLVLEFFPYESFSKVLQTMSNGYASNKLKRWEKFGPVLSFLFDQNVDFIEVCHNHLLRRLNTEVNANRAFDLARTIDNYAVYLRIQENGLLLTRVYEVMSVAHSVNNKNPYIVFGYLNKSRRLEIDSSLLMEISVGGLKIKPHIEGLAKLRPKGHLYKDLPQVDPNAFKSIVQSLEMRYANLTESEKKKVRNAVEHLTGWPFYSFDKFFNNPYFSYLLTKEDPQKTAPKLVSYWVKLVDLVLKQYTHLVHGKVLTPQEELFYSLGMNLMTCGPGNDINIESTYKVLIGDDQSESSAGLGEELVENKILNFVNNIISECFFSDNLIKSLSNISHTPNNFNHFVRYARNLIGPHIGGDDSIEFDPYTGCLNNTIIKIDLVEAINIFFSQLFGPTNAINRIAGFVNNIITNDNGEIFYNNIVAILDKQGEFVIADCFEEDEDSVIGNKLSDNGGLALLLALDLFRVTVES